MKSVRLRWSRPVEITQRQITGPYDRLPRKLRRKQRVNSYTNVSHSKQQVFVIKSHLTSTYSYTLYAHQELKQSVFQLFPLFCQRGVGGVGRRRPARLSVQLSFVLTCRLTKHTVQQVTGSRDDVLLFVSLRRSFCATSEHGGVSRLSLATKQSVELMRLYQSACHVIPVRRRALLKFSFYDSESIRKGNEGCW